MNLSISWQKVFSKYFDFVFVVEGKKDSASLRAVGFEKIYEIHKAGVSLHERIEEIVGSISKKDTVCILMDFDKKGKQLYSIVQREMQAFGVRLDSSFRKILLSLNVSHIEGLDSFVENHSID